jgi:hypothetical protein
MESLFSIVDYLKGGVRYAAGSVAGCAYSASARTGILTGKLITLYSDSKLQQKILDRWDPGDDWCGRLICHRTRPGVHHYGVGLSNDWMLSWGDGGATGGFSVHRSMHGGLQDSQACSEAKLQNRIGQDYAGG